MFKSLVTIILFQLIVQQVFPQNITLTKNSPYSTHINKGERQLFLFKVEQKWFDIYDKVVIRVLVSNLVNIRVYQGDSCGIDCVTNDRLRLITDSITLYKENTDSNQDYVIEVKSKNSYNYKITVIARFDQHPHSIKLMNDQIAMKGMIGSASINYYDFNLKKQDYFEINLKTENDYENNYLEILVGVKTEDGLLPKFIESKQIIKQGKKQLIISIQDKGYQKNKEYIIGVRSITYSIYMRKAEVHYSIEINTQNKLRFISINHEYRLNQDKGSKVNYQLYIGDLREDLKLTYYDIQQRDNSTGVEVRLVDDLVESKVQLVVQPEQIIGQLQLDQMCSEQRQNCTVYLEVTNSRQTTLGFVMGLQQNKMPVRLLTNQPVQIDLVQLQKQGRKTYFYVPHPEGLANLVLHIDAPRDGGLDLKYAFIKDIGLIQINEYLYNKIDNNMKQMYNQHTARLQIDSTTVQQCHPYCLVVVVVSLASGVKQHQEGVWTGSLQMVEGALQLQMQSSYSINLAANSSQSMFLNTGGLYEQEKVLYIQYKQQFNNDQLITTVIDFSGPNGLITTNNINTTTYYSNQIGLSGQQLKDTQRIRIRISSQKPTSLVLSTSAVYTNYVFPKDLHEFDITHSHKNSFMLLNTLNTTALKIKIVDDSQYDYSPMSIKIKKCSNVMVCDKEARTTIILINENNEFIFDNIYLVGNNVQMFTYYLLEFDLVRSDIQEMKGLFYIDESPNDYERLFMNHQHVQQEQESKELKRYSVKFYEGHIFSYKVRLDIKQGDPRLAIIFQDHHYLKQDQITKALHNNAVGKQTQGQNYLLTYVDEYLATLAFKHYTYKHQDTTHYFNNVKEIDLPIYVQCNDKCSYTLEVSDQGKQQMRFNQVYKGDEGVFDNKTSLRLTRTPANKDKYLYMFIAFKESQGNSLQDLDLNVFQFDSKHKQGNGIGTINSNSNKVVFRSKQFMEVRLPAISKEFYQVSFNNNNKHEVLFNIENEVMLLPLHHQLNRHIQGNTVHKYMFDNPWKEGYIKIRLVKCQGQFTYRFSEDDTSGSYIQHFGGFELVNNKMVFRKYGQYFSVDGEFTYKIETSSVSAREVLLEVQNNEKTNGLYKIYLSFHEIGEYDLEQLIQPSSLNISVTEDQQGQIETSVEPINKCNQQGCSQYDLSSMIVEYEFILTNQQHLLDTVGHCRFQLEEAQLFHSHGQSASYSLSPELTQDTKFTRVESTRFQQRYQKRQPSQEHNNKALVNETFQRVVSNSMLLVVATVSNVQQLKKDGSLTLLNPLRIQYQVQDHKQLLLNSGIAMDSSLQNTQSDSLFSKFLQTIYHFLFLFLAFIFLILLFLYRRQNRVNQVNNQKLQNQIHQIRADDYVGVDKALKDTKETFDMDIEVPTKSLIGKDQYTEL